jgi:hypothetical protein
MCAMCSAHLDFIEFSSNYNSSTDITVYKIGTIYLVACGSVLAKALRNKPEGRGFEARLGE